MRYARWFAASASRAIRSARWRGGITVYLRSRALSLQRLDRIRGGRDAGAVAAMRGGEIRIRAMLAGEEQPCVHRRGERRARRLRALRAIRIGAERPRIARPGALD